MSKPRPKPSIQERFAVIPERSRLPKMDNLIELAEAADEITSACDDLSAAAADFSSDVEQLADYELDRYERADVREHLAEVAETLGQLLEQLGRYCDAPTADDQASGEAAQQA